MNSITEGNTGAGVVSTGQMNSQTLRRNLSLSKSTNKLHSSQKQLQTQVSLNLSVQSTPISNQQQQQQTQLRLGNNSSKMNSITTEQTNATASSTYAKINEEFLNSM